MDKIFVEDSRRIKSLRNLIIILNELYTWYGDFTRKDVIDFIKKELQVSERTAYDYILTLELLRNPKMLSNITKLKFCHNMTIKEVLENE